MAKVRLCVEDELRLVGELRDASKLLNDFGVAEIVNLTINSDGDVQGIFLIEEEAESYLKVTVRDEGDRVTLEYADGSENWW